MKNSQPTLYMDEILDINRSGLSIERTKSEIRRLNEPDVDLYIWITNKGISAGRAFVGSACDNTLYRKTSLTQGPSRGVIETAEVISFKTILL